MDKKFYYSKVITHDLIKFVVYCHCEDSVLSYQGVKNSLKLDASILPVFN
jgi:hypothetical protein